MPGKIFLNYRRNDDPGFTQALYMRLEHEFSDDDLFMDIEGHIRPGDDFVQVLDEQVAKADVVLSVIGPRWVELLAARETSDDDFVVVELRSALDRGKRVIPVLVGGAQMPHVDVLPEAIRSLARRNAVGLRPDRFKADCQGLVTALKQHLEETERERAAASEAERLKAAEARQKRQAAEAQNAERVRLAEERARIQAAQGLSSEEIRKAEELANWNFIEKRSDVADLRDHLARFPGGVTERYALSQLEDIMWTSLGNAPDETALRAFIDEFPKGSNTTAARAMLASAMKRRMEQEAAAKLRAAETEQWSRVASSTDKAEIEAFISTWPNGAFVTAARDRLVELSRSPVDIGLYWQMNTTMILLSIATAALFTMGVGIVLRPLVSGLGFGGNDIGFLASQFSPVVFTVVMFAYAWRMDAIERRLKLNAPKDRT